MEILVVDNGTRCLPALRGILADLKCNVNVVPWYGISSDGYRPQEFHGIIISGSSVHPPVRTEVYGRQYEMINRSTIPVLGICAGMHAVNNAFGGESVRNNKKHKGIVTLHDIKDDPITFGLPKTGTIFASHHWVVGRMGSGVFPLAMTETGVGIIRRREHPTYGIQGHPEVKHKETIGEKLIVNFLNIIENQI